MRAFTHPSPQDITLTGILHALGDPVRLALLAQLSCGTAQNCSMVAQKLENLSLSTRHHHLRVLREAGLIRSEKKGTSVMNQLRHDELEKRFPGLLESIFSHARASCSAK